MTYYRNDLAYVHDQGFGFHADACAPGILALLQPLLARGGDVLELGCGSGHLTRHLVAAGHRVVATDASPAMVELTRQRVPDAAEIRTLKLPDEPLPPADAVVSVGHVLSYLPDEAAVHRGLVAVATTLRSGGVLALDLCDLRWGQVRDAAPNFGRAGEDWALVTQFSVPAPNLFRREMTTFVRQDDGSWRRDDEQHDNVLVDTGRVPDLLAPHGVDASLSSAFGPNHELPDGLVAITGRKHPA